MSMSNDWLGVVALAASACACFTDLRTRTIPNWLTLGLLGAGVLGHGVHAGFYAGLGAIASGLLCGALPYFLFARNALGGGDVKMFAAFGAVLGTGRGLELQLLAFALLAGFAIVDAFMRGQLWRFLGGSLRASASLVRTRSVEPEYVGRELPMGGAILLAMAALCVRGWVS